MRSLWQDIRYGFRMLFKSPGVSIIATITLALGVGANTVIFSVVNTILLRPLPYQHPDRLMLIQESIPKVSWSEFTVSPAEFLNYQTDNEVFSELAAFAPLDVNLTGHGEAQRIRAARVSATLFPMLGVAPLRGRVFFTRRRSGWEKQSGNA